MYSFEAFVLLWLFRIDIHVRLSGNLDLCCLFWSLDFYDLKIMGSNFVLFVQTKHLRCLYKSNWIVRYVYWSCMIHITSDFHSKSYCYLMRLWVEMLIYRFATVYVCLCLTFSYIIWKELQIMASSLNGLTVGDNMPDNLMDSPVRFESTIPYHR